LRSFFVVVVVVVVVAAAAVAAERKLKLDLLCAFCCCCYLCVVTSKVNDLLTSQLNLISLSPSFSLSLSFLFLSYNSVCDIRTSRQSTMMRKLSNACHVPKDVTVVKTLRPASLNLIGQCERAF